MIHDCNHDSKSFGMAYQFQGQIQKIYLGLLRPEHNRRQVAATGLCDKLLRVYYLQNKSLRHHLCSVHTE